LTRCQFRACTDRAEVALQFGLLPPRSGHPYPRRLWGLYCAPHAATVRELYRVEDEGPAGTCSLAWGELRPYFSSWLSRGKSGRPRSLRHLAQAADLPPSTLAGIVSGRRRAGSQTAAKLLAVVGVELDALYERGRIL